MAVLRGVAATLAFALEIAMLAAFAIWAVHVFQPALLGVVAAVLIDAVVIVVWGSVLAPKAGRRLPFGPRVVVEFVLESASAIALWGAGQEQSALVLASLIVVRFGLGLATGADREGL